MLAGLALLASCGGGGPKGPPEDQALALSLAAGDEAMSLRRPADAVRDYRDAYGHALARDDPDAIATAGTDLVIALTHGKPGEALAQADDVGRALGRRQAVSFELALARAAALLRLDRPADAEAAAAAAENAPSPDVAARAAFLRGLAAARLGATDRLASSLARLGVDRTVSLTWQADRAELGSRLALARGQPAALALAREAARLRRLALDYRGMRRALRLASSAALLAGETGLAASLAGEAEDSARSDPQAKAGDGALPL